jgi:Peptidase family M28/PDZ domain
MPKRASLRSSLRIAACSLAVSLAASVAASTSAVLAGSFNSAVEKIQKQDLRKHCSVLASDAFRGREMGTSGGEAAGAYLVGELRKRTHVLPAAPEGDYFQPFLPNGRNILVRLPGNDPDLGREYIVIGAHYDHVGLGNARNSRGPIGQIHNGADDNASGASALLELVDAFSSLDVAPKRSLLFVFWDGEEKGLLGSQYWISAPTVPLDQIRLVINVDMIGRLRQNRAEVFGSRSAPGLRRLLASQNIESPIAMDFTWETRRDSDHYSFFAQQIPYLMIFTGKHPDYHTPYDDVDKLNFGGMERITRLMFRTVYAAAQQANLPPFRAAAFQEGGQAQLDAQNTLPDAPVRLGVTWDEARAKQKRIEVTEIDSGSAAESAGFQVGDHVLEFDGTRIASSDDMRGAVAVAGEPATALVERSGFKSPRVLTVHLQGTPNPIGAFYRFDDAEPGAAIVSRVIPKSSAARAGLRANDRIERVARRSFSTPSEFAALLATQQGPFQAVAERDGELEILEIVPRAARRVGKIPPSSPR